MRREYTPDERLKRAAWRSALLIRGMWQEKGSSDTRLVDRPLIPDDLTTVGQSKGCVTGSGYREHVVPRKVIIDRCHMMLEAEDSDTTLEQMAGFIVEHLKIVRVTEDEAKRLNAPGIKQSMPTNWVVGGDIFARLKDAGVDWVPLPNPAIGQGGD